MTMDLTKRVSLFLALFALAVALQWLGNAYAVEPGVQVDEPRHLITGLMARDWAAAGFPRPAAQYAEDYGAHYPRVAWGQWPPVFYVAQAAWTLILPPSRVTILLLMAALTALLCLRTAEGVPGPAAGLAGALMLLTLVPVLIYSRLVMAEMLLCWLCLEAVLAFAAWMEAPGAKRAGWFAFWAAAAILTKITAVWLAPMAVIALVLSGRRTLWREKSLWGAGLAVVALTAPWYLLEPGALQQAGPAAIAGSFPRRARIVYDLARTLVVWLGPLLLAALWGARELWKRGAALAPVAAACVLGMEMVRFAVPATAFDHRTIMPLLAPLMICAAAGIAPALARFPAATAVALACLGGASVLSVTPKQGLHVEAAARFCASRPEYRDAPIWLGAEFSREGAFIAELALAEQRPGHRVLLSPSKAPAGSMALIVIESDPRLWRTPQVKLLAGTIAGHRGTLRLVHSSELLVYESAAR